MTFAYYPETRLALYEGDCLKQMQQFPEASVDAVVTDPPYGLSKEPDMAEVMRHWLAGDDYKHSGNGFMGKSWDSFVPGPSVWRECFRVLKPGGHLLSFAGSRTQDLMGLAIRLAGFEIRDSIAWLYGSGFPKSLDVSRAIDKAAGAQREVVGFRPQFPDGTRGARARPNASPEVYGDRAGLAGEIPVTAPATEAAQQWQGWGTALKPAFEPIVVARKPLTGTVAANVLQHGTGALNIDGCRVGDELITAHGGGNTGVHRVYNGDQKNGQGIPAIERGSNPRYGRWPTNVVLDESQAAELDAQTGVLTSGTGAVKRRSSSKRDGNTGATYGAESRAEGTPMLSYGDSGGASRFFPVFKYQAKAPARERPKVDGVAHPTVKPLDLMLWLVRLVTPPEGVVLDPFAGSGTTLEAALLEGFYAVGIENTPEYVPLILERLRRRFPEWGTAV